MMMDTLEEFKKQHLDNYKKAIFELIRNNTDVLVNEDFMSLLRKPPLDSMDSIKSKYLDLAKKNKIVLDIVKLDSMLESYRNDVSKCCDEIRKIRIDSLENIVNSITLVKDTDVIKFNKKDFNEINKNIKKFFKEFLQDSVERKLINCVDGVFSDEIDGLKKKKICDEIVKFIKGNYQKQLIESIDFKVLVKDTTLINGVKEQSERYLFTLANSRIFKQLDK